MEPLPTIALTLGDPAGVGPELCLRAAADSRVLEACRPVIIGDRAILERVGERLSLALPVTVVESPDQLDRVDAGGAMLWHQPAPAGAIEPGVASAAGGRASYDCLLLAIEQTLAGRFAAITTAPLTKRALHLAGIDEPGHTEILARRTGAPRAAMMLYSERIAVGLVTIHQELASVPGSLSIEAIFDTIELTGATLRRIRGHHPRLGVLGLNPHAGEGGLFGDEEGRIIAPAIERARAAGWQVEGPLVPDAAFTQAALGRFDAHVVMYHDQGLIPFKMLSFHDGVNVTMGLPIVRTSPDHGTAYDIAWSGRADAGSMVAAVRLAARLGQGASSD